MYTTTVFHKGRHLSENELVPLNQECPFCKSKDRKKIFKIQNNPDVYLYKCNKCFAASADRMPTSDALDNYYSNYYIDNKKGVTTCSEKKFAKHIYKVLLKNNYLLENKSIFKILDFGGGSGIITYNLAALINQSKNNLIIEIDIVDYNKNTAVSEFQNIKINQFDNLSHVAKTNYDIIIASAVIEHIPDAGKTISDLFSLMKDNSIFYARTPYVLPIMRIFSFFRVKVDFTFPAHVHDLDDKFWKGFIENMQIHGKYIILKSQPSIVETSLKHHFARTLISYLFKKIWFFLRFWKIVGGWEIFILKQKKGVS